MNEVWSKYIQGINTLYCSRKLRFHDMFYKQYKELFGLSEDKPLKILEIGCGLGALAGALSRWYPKSEIFAIDRDSAFIEFAKEKEKGIRFIEGECSALPFADNTFDVTISYTVAEHIAPQTFYGEQLRVLKPNGVCLVLSARRGITTPNVVYNEFEKAFWERIEKQDERLEKYSVGKYAMTETELPLAMQEYGFKNVSTGYTTVALTPDNPTVSKALAYEMINATQQTALDGIKNVVNAFPNCFSQEEIEKMQMYTNEKYRRRIEQYDKGEKQWDTSISVTMAVRGIKGENN